MAAGAVSAPLIIPIVHLQTHRTKNHIDTTTPVTIQSDSAGVLLFFTLDGSNPAVAVTAAVTQRGSAAGTRKYSEPIRLPAGRVSVRAVAVTGDGRQSSVVTKVFSVDAMDRDHDHVRQMCQQPPSEGTSRSTESSESSAPPAGPCFLSSRLDPQATATQTTSLQDSGQLTSRERRETNFLRCARCLRLRPPDPSARFCSHCGSVVPQSLQQRLPPAEGGEMLTCVFCNSLVPINTHTCLICEADVMQQPQLTLQDHLLCVFCGSANPTHLSSCVSCERRLQTADCDSSAPSVLTADCRTLTCSTCHRVNCSDARFCDWCGSKLCRAANCAMCWKCGASGHPHTFCGVFLEAPPTPCSDITHPAQGITTSGAPAPPSGAAAQQPTPSLGPASGAKLSPPTVDQYTQTIGLYYPSATELQRKEQQKAGDHRSPLTTISPGRGYWRKQLDHVCAHLRSHAQNNAPFRALLGEPRLGPIVSAVIQDDRYEVSLTVSFMAHGRGRGRGQDGPEDEEGPAGGGGPIGPRPAGGGGPVGPRPAGGGGAIGPRPSGESRLAVRPQVKDSQLLKELGPGRGQIGAVQQLLDQGADPSCRGAAGRHALAIAVVNGHHDVLPVLVQRGADVDEQSGRMKNTALHEAAALGAAGLRCAEVLLRCKASVRRRNAGGQTAYDVAVSSGCSGVASLLAARTEQENLDDD